MTHFTKKMFFKNVLTYCWNFIVWVYTGTAIWIFWILLHFIASHLYSKLCVPLTFTGFLMSPFISPAPHCVALRWAIYNGGNVIIHMWTLLASLFISYLILPDKKIVTNS